VGDQPVQAIPFSGVPRGGGEVGWGMGWIGWMGEDGPKRESGSEPGRRRSTGLNRNADGVLDAETHRRSAFG
jgi:hypothetical protein